MHIFWLYQQPIWVLPILMLAILLLAIETGYRLGLHARRRIAGGKPVRDMTLTGLLALLGLLLSFTYGYSLSRADLRKVALMDEVNAIGTAFAAARLAPEPERAELQRRLLGYARTRIASTEEWRSPSGRQRVLQRTLDAQAELWPTAERAMASGVAAPLQPVIFNSVRDVMDIHTKRLGFIFDRIPPAVLLLLIAVAAAALATTAFNTGIEGRINRWRMMLFALVLTAVVSLIVDYDTEGEGFVELRIGPLESVITQMETALAGERDE